MNYIVATFLFIAIFSYVAYTGSPFQDLCLSVSMLLSPI